MAVRELYHLLFPPGECDYLNALLPSEYSCLAQLAYESQKSKKIIASRDISFAFTNEMANNYYSLRSYNHFCFFEHITDSTKTIDDFAFFVFFTFKSLSFSPPAPRTPTDYPRRLEALAVG